MIYRFSIFITGESYIPLTKRELQNYHLLIYSSWKRGDTFQQRGKNRRYDYGGSHLLHSSIFVSTEEERTKIIEDYLNFFEENIGMLKGRGATELEIAATIYLEKPERFLLLKRMEMERLLHCGNIPVRLDILYLSKNEYENVQNDMIKERGIEV